MALFAVLTRVFYVGVLDVGSSDSSSSDSGNDKKQAQSKPEAVSFSRVYRDVNTNASDDDSSLSRAILSMVWGNESSYTLGRKIGQGRHSSVFIGTEASTGKQYAVKALKPTTLAKAFREIRAMKALTGCPNTAHMHDAYRDAKGGRVHIVQDLAEGVPLKRLVPALTANETRAIAHKLLEALECAHSHGVMHRDVKPQNVMYDRETGALSLADWGLAEFYVPGRRYNVSVASASYKPPELLVKMRYYDYSLDMWSFGCVLAEMLLKERRPLFRGSTECRTLRAVAEVLGSKDITEYTSKYNLRVPCRGLSSGLGHTPLCTTEKAKTKGAHTGRACKALDTKGLDLLRSLLVIDHSKRLTAAEALHHPYFL